MFRFVRSIGVAVTLAITAAVAVPTGIAGATSFGFVWITYRGERYVGDVTPVEAEVGSTITLTAVSQIDDPVSFYWTVSSTPAGGEVSRDDENVTVKCDAEGTIAVDVVMTSDDGGTEDSSDVVVVCSRNKITRLELGGPVDPTRTVIPLGTTLTFESVPLSPDVPTVWRSTGWARSFEARRITRTFDQVGNFGVEVSAATAAGLLKKWVGYTVIAPPTASIVPGQSDLPATVPVGTKVTFDGSGSQSPGGGSLVYQWRTSGVSGVAGDGARFTRDFDKAGTIGVELIVINELGQRAKKRVEVKVVPTSPPVVSVTPAPANPKARMKVDLGSTVTFDGRASRDPDGGAVTYQWRTTGVNGVAGSASTYSRKFTTAGNYGVELTVTDDEGQTAKRWVGITVEP